MLFDFFDPEADLLEGLSTHKNSTRPEFKNGANASKYIASSALQKALRRKSVAQAMQAAQMLKQIDEPYLFRRLKCCALEDCGPAALDVVAQVLWVGNKQDWMSKHGGSDLVLSYLIHRLCNSKGCRATDDLLYCVSKHPLYAHQRQSFAKLPAQELMEAFHDPSLDWVEKTLLLCYLCGTRYRNDDLVLKKGNPDLVLQLCCDMGAPPFVCDTLKLSKSYEFYISLLPAWMMLEQSKTVEVINDAREPSVMINGWASESYDRHTREGKRAFRILLQRCETIREFLQKHCPDADPVNLVGWGAFIVEGQCLNNRLVYNGSETLRELAAQAWLHSGGMEREAQEEFIALMDDHKEELHHARASI